MALAGRPNVGKSTLVNRLVGEHVAAVSARPQTTRRRALGVVNREGYQLVLVDLPGFQKPFDRLTERMQRSVNETLADADATVLMLDARAPVGSGDRYIAARVLAEGAPPCVIAVNKTDGLGPDRIVPILAEAVGLGDPHAVHPISALTGEGVDALLDDLLALLPEGPAWFPPGMVTDQSLEQRIAELVRERALELTRDEVPHAVAVLVESITPGRGPTRGRGQADLRDRVAEGDPDRPPRRDGQADRQRGPPGRRAGGGRRRCSWSCPSRCGRAGAATRASSTGSGCEPMRSTTLAVDARYRPRRSSDRRSMASLDRMITSSRRAMEQRRDARPLAELESAVRDLAPIRPFTESVVGEEIAFVLRVGDADAALLAAAAPPASGAWRCPATRCRRPSPRRRFPCCTRAC